MVHLVPALQILREKQREEEPAVCLMCWMVCPKAKRGKEVLVTFMSGMMKEMKFAVKKKLFRWCSKVGL